MSDAYQAYCNAAEAEECEPLTRDMWEMHGRPTDVLGTVQCPTEITVNGIAVRLGCYIDGHYGQYAGDRLADIVGEFTGDEGYSDVIAAIRLLDGLGYDVTDAWQGWFEEYNTMEAALNEVTPEGYRWGWSDGEFFLLPDAWWEVES